MAIVAMHINTLDTLHGCHFAGRLGRTALQGSFVYRKSGAGPICSPTLNTVEASGNAGGRSIIGVTIRALAGPAVPSLGSVIF